MLFMVQFLVIKHNEARCPEKTRLMMQTKKYVQQLYRALVIGCMIYAVTLIADTAAAAGLANVVTIASVK